ncbi:MAG TPA: hypothetical protein QF611_03445, partial [Pseudomonadales bacterium]|nr:hypothetical protein [Pseudomonadales bacterium]
KRLRGHGAAPDHGLIVVHQLSSRGGLLGTTFASLCYQNRALMVPILRPLLREYSCTARINSAGTSGDDGNTIS